MDVVIIANGDIDDINYIKDILKDKYIICVDGGAKYLRYINVLPNVLIGDLDSIDTIDLEWIKKGEVKYKKFPTKKDETDTELALEYAFNISPKPKSITIIGALGSRQDHSMANIMLLYNILKQKIVGKIVDKNNEIMITDSSIKVQGEIGDLLSIIPISTIVRGVTLKGLEYQLVNRDMYLGSSLGISNVFASDNAEIHIKEGLILVIKSKE